MKGQTSLFMVLGVLILLIFVIGLFVYVVPSVYHRYSSDPVQVFVDDCYREVSGCWLFHHGLARQDKGSIEKSLDDCYDGFSGLPGDVHVESKAEVSVTKNKAETVFSGDQRIILKQIDSEKVLDRFSSSHPVRLKYLEGFSVGTEMDLNLLRRFDGTVRLYQFE